MKRILLYILSLSFLTYDVCAQEKGVIIKSKASADTASIDFERRIALVIGNAAYKKSGLKNPANDANAMAKLLTKYGFEVILKTDVDRSAINKLINEFGDSITKKKGVSFFYYSGHGMQYNSQNYILPLSCAIEKESDIEDEAVKLNKVFEKMNLTGNGLNFVILDACRNNLYQESLPNLQKGLTDKEQLPSNTYVFFATSPGKVALDGAGKNSPFTESLLTTIRDSMEFFQVVKKVVKDVKSKTNPVQQPSIAGSPEEDFIFIPKQTAGKSKSSAYKPMSSYFTGSGGDFVPRSFDFTETPDFTAHPPGAKLYLLSIGISNYNNLPQLLYAHKDAIDVADNLTRQGGFFYDSVVTYLFLNEQATYYNILRGISDIKKKARPGDMIMMFFAGHNLKPEHSSSSYFIPFDGEINDFIAASSFKYEDIRSFLAEAPCKSILFLDGNYSPAAAEDLKEIENGVAVFASTRPGQQSLEGAEWQNGLFAKALVDGISGFADADSSGYVNLYELTDYLERRMKTASEGRQIPSFFIPPVLLKFKISKAIRREEKPVLMIRPTAR